MNKLIALRKRIEASFEGEQKHWETVLQSKQFKLDSLFYAAWEFLLRIPSFVHKVT